MGETERKAAGLMLPTAKRSTKTKSSKILVFRLANYSSRFFFEVKSTVALTLAQPTTAWRTGGFVDF